MREAQRTSEHLKTETVITENLSAKESRIENTKLVTDPAVEDNEFNSKSIDTFKSSKTNTNANSSNLNAKTL